jgi:hypothetical protein
LSSISLIAKPIAPQLGQTLLLILGSVLAVKSGVGCSIKFVVEVASGDCTGKGGGGDVYDF